MAENNFDFKAFNSIMKPAKTGLRLFLAIQLLKDVEETYRRFNSPFAREVIDINDELADLRKRVQDYVAKLDNSGNTEKIDNQEELKNASSSADAGKVAA